MQYLGIDLHRKQMTVSLRNHNGDVILRRQASTRWRRLTIDLAPISTGRNHLTQDTRKLCFFRCFREEGVRSFL